MQMPWTRGQHRVEAQGGQRSKGLSSRRWIESGIFDAGSHDRETMAVDEQASGINGGLRHDGVFAPGGRSDSIYGFSREVQD